jgi:hypothetical protein
MAQIGKRPGVLRTLKQWMSLSFRVIPAWLAVPLVLFGVHRVVKNPDVFPAELFVWITGGVCAFAIVAAVLMSFEPRRPFPWKPYGEDLEDSLEPQQPDEPTPAPDPPRWQPVEKSRRRGISRPVYSPRCRHDRKTGRFSTSLGSRFR